MTNAEVSSDKGFAFFLARQNGTPTLSDNLVQHGHPIFHLAEGGRLDMEISYGNERIMLEGLNRQFSQIFSPILMKNVSLSENVTEAEVNSLNKLVLLSRYMYSGHRPPAESRVIERLLAAPGLSK
jgi:hypothetical protein